jgi:hypothetical protein
MFGSAGALDLGLLLGLGRTVLCEEGSEEAVDGV